MRYASLLLGAMLAISPTLFAQTEPTAAQMAQREVQRYSLPLGLSSSQQEQALTIFTTEATTEAPIRKSLQLAHETLDTAIKANNVETITQVSTMLGQLDGQSTLAHSVAIAQFYAQLTTEQQTKFNQMRPSNGPNGSMRR